MIGSEDILDFWLQEVGPKGWYKQDDALDATIRTRFKSLWLQAQEEGHLGWGSAPRPVLALLIVLDQFPRNMFRGDGRSFASDRLARAVAKRALAKGYDRRIEGAARQFFYMPLMHSECLEDQERCVRLMLERMPESSQSNLLHARAHREVIRRFGRFPHRNADLGRRSTAAEIAFLGAGGYGAVVEGLQAAA
ncbi:MAG: DUF924 family protein [Qingshengfaniella sp.]